MPRRVRGFAIHPGRLPRHIGIIMDGNGRWARQRGMNRIQGHRAGSRAVRRTVKTCRSIGIPCLTLYAFSAQNWGRPKEEVSALMDLLGEFIAKEWQEIMQKDIRVVHLGELRRVPADVRQRLRELVSATRKNRSMVLALALSYGSREEIVRAARNLSRQVATGKLSANRVTQEAFFSFLHTHNLPDPDLIIRTGGEQRISNFLLWQSAYAEYVFSPVLWPDFGEEDLLAAIGEYQHRRRRFGLTDEQIHAKDSAEE